jgi:hypothetical protein
MGRGKGKKVGTKGCHAREEGREMRMVMGRGR